MKHIDRAWAVGLFEGEGCFSLHSNGTTLTLYPQLRLGMQDKDVVQRFQRIVGCGAIYVAPANRNSRSNYNHYTWCAYTKSDCKRVIKQFFPMLGQRRQARALQVLKYCA